MHIGLIGGIGPAATDLYYRALIDRHAAGGTVPDITIVHADVKTMSANLVAGKAQAQAEIFARLVGRLKAAGAEAAAVTSMGGHFCINELEPIAPLPMLHGPLAVAQAIRTKGIKAIGILGTRLVMATGLYGHIKPARIVIPEGPLLDKVHDTYVAMAGIGRITEEQKRFFHEMGAKLCREQGAEAVLLGGTDLFLAFQGQDPGYPVLDAADIHAEAIYRHSIQG